jgi:hypothetical protein
MKKLFALFLISIMLLSSCAETSDSGQEITDETTAETVESVDNSQNREIEMKPTNGIVVTNKYPLKDADYANSETPPPSDIKYILSYKKGNGRPSKEDYEFIRSAIACEKNIEYNIVRYNSENSDNGHSYKSTTQVSGIVDNDEKLKSFYDEFVISDFQTYTVKYSDNFSDKFFEDNIIIFSMSNHDEGVFVGFEYGFDPSSKTLKIVLTTRPHEGWHECTEEFGGLIIYLVNIPRSDITIDGKIVPYEEINIEYAIRLTGY